jgi:putative phosphoesterase
MAKSPPHRAAVGAAAQTRARTTTEEAAEKTARRSVADALTVGLISDTHGLLRPEAIAALAGVERIIHAGDIGGPDLLESLRRIAPVDAVRGNNDKGPWAREVPPTTTLQVGSVWIHVLHDVTELDLDPIAAGLQVVVAGHSHKPAVTERDGVLYVNPGSAGPRRFSLPVTVGFLDILGDRVTARILDIL